VLIQKSLLLCKICQRSQDLFLLGSLLKVATYSGMLSMLAITLSGVLFISTAACTGPFGLFCEVFCPSIPELGYIEYRIKHCGSIPWTFLPTMTCGCFLKIDATHANIMAGIAAYKPTFRNSWLKNSIFPSSYFSLV